MSRASLRIRILDVNDNPPELATPYEAAVCEDAKPGQVASVPQPLSRAAGSALDQCQPAHLSPSAPESSCAAPVTLGVTLLVPLSPSAGSKARPSLWPQPAMPLAVATRG